MIIRFVESCTHKSIEGSNEENKDHEERKETGNIFNTGTKQRNHVTDGGVHSEDGENLHGGGTKDNDVAK